MGYNKKKKKNSEAENIVEDTVENGAEQEVNEAAEAVDTTENQKTELTENTEAKSDESSENNSECAENGGKSDVSVEDFLSSLDNYKSEQTESESKKKRTKINWGWVAMLSVCLVVLIVSAVMIGLNIYEGHSSDKINEELNKDFFGGSDRTDLMAYLSPVVLQNAMPKYGAARSTSSGMDYEIVETNNPVHEQFKQKLIEYRKINPDIYGWIQVDGTDISYAVVRGQDNSFYLNHTATKEYNTNGAIFADFRCEDNVLDNPNFVIYGHNSSYLKQMFSQIDRFLDQAFFEQNRYITIYTIDGVYRYEIFAIYETYSTYSYCQMNFISDNSFVNWCNEMKENSLYPRNITDFTSESRIITLSTCTNGYFSRRYSLQGKLVRVEK